MADVYMAGDLRNNNTFELDGNVFKVVEFQHVKPGKGAAFVRVKMKNVITGAVIERTFNPSEKLQGAEIEKKEMQYLYNDGELYSGILFKLSSSNKTSVLLLMPKILFKYSNVLFISSLKSYKGRKPV